MVIRDFRIGQKNVPMAIRTFQNGQKNGILAFVCFHDRQIDGFLKVFAGFRDRQGLWSVVFYTEMRGSQSRRDCILQPRVASPRATLGMRQEKRNNPERVASRRAGNGCNPFRVGRTSVAVTQGSASAQPWAE